MKTHVPLFLILLPVFITVSGCGSKLDNFNDVRDFIMNEADESFRTTVELAVNTDNLGIIGNHIRDLDFDTDDYEVSGIEKVEFGVYRVQNDRTIQVSTHLLLNDVNKMTRRLKRAGYDTIIRNKTEEELSLGLIRETRGTKKGAGYFIQLKPDRFVLVKIDGDFKKL